MVKGAEKEPKDYERFLKKLSLVSDEGSLRKLEYSPLEASADFTEDSFASAYDGLEVLKTANPAEYSQLTLGDQTALLSYSAGEVENSRRSLLDYAQEEFRGFTRRKSKDLATLVWETEETSEKLLGLAFGMPHFRKENGEKYNGVIDKIEFSIEENRSASEDPSKYLGSKMTNLNGAQKAFFIPFGQRIIGEYLNLARNNAVTALGEYWVPAFISENIKRANTLGNKQREAMNALEEEARARIKALGENPDKKEAESLARSYAKRGENVGKEYQEITGKLYSILDALGGITRETIEVKREKKKQEEARKAD